MPSEEKHHIRNSPLKAETNLASTPITREKSGSAATAATASKNSPSNATIILAPRFTNEEKQILYSLFSEHEDVIDIKNRKKQKGMYSVRDAWKAIVDGFNGHPTVLTTRNLKQIQKFWLNARLRKQYPLKAATDVKPNITRKASVSGAASAIANQPAVITVPPPIKSEPEYIVPTRDTPDSTDQADEIEEIELQGSSEIGHDLTAESLESLSEAEQNQQEDHNQEENAEQQQHQHATIQAQQINVDQISTEKLTLNDLLHFKTARPREQIILQIKQHPDDGNISLPSPTCVSIPYQQSTFNQIIGEIKGQPETSHIQVQHYQTQQVQQQTPHQITQQYNAGNSTYCNYTTQHLPHVTTSSHISQAASLGNATNLVVADSFEHKFNYFKLKEAELRFKEVQLQLEQKRIELSRMQEELRHLKEMHRLQVDEMRIKIRILNEEEKQLRNKESVRFGSYAIQ